MVGTNLQMVLPVRSGLKSHKRTDVRSYSALDDLLRNVLQTIFVNLVISFIDGEVEAVCPVDLDIQEAWAKAIIVVSLESNYSGTQKLFHRPKWKFAANNRGSIHDRLTSRCFQQDQ